MTVTTINTSDWKLEHRNIISKDVFLQTPASYPLRVCCYGSSSEFTPMDYLKEAYSLGYALGKRNHTCVNGAGLAGCMSAMNDGAFDADGNIVGVIHEMFVVDGSDWKEGSHSIFDSDRKNSNSKNRQLLIAGGNDLQQRKKMLVDKADAVVVCPGGPGTFDELWEMACSRNINLIDIPIVCINVQQFYDPFIQMLHRVYKDQLIKKQPHEIVHFVSNGLEAVRYIEEWYQERRTVPRERSKPKLRHPSSFLERLGSIMSLTGFTSFLENDAVNNPTLISGERKRTTLHFISGMVVGATLIATMYGKYERKK